MNSIHRYNVVIIGSGAAGLSLALKLPKHLKVAVLAKSNATSGSTNYAQGGISAVLDPKNDSLQSHIDDTLNAGAGLCDPDAVNWVVSQAAEQINWLEKLGMPFTRQTDQHQLHLTREGGHSSRRVAHAKDATGHALQKTLLSHVRATDNIDILDSFIAIDVITENVGGRKQAIGIYALNHKTNRVETFCGQYIALATGGASKVYLYTSNPDGSTGDGIAMAWRAGCQVSNMEFVQFHPTCLYEPRAKSFLISEAVRGEGGQLLLPDGTRFMHKFDHRGELAPRDIVARGIDHEMKRLGIDCVYLDISHKGAAFITEHFPTIYKTCKEFGYDITRQPIPTVPAAHYTCGGVLVDKFGRTSVDNLFAIGEVSCTGLHGANRLASNSLIECLVYADASASYIAQHVSDSQAIPAAAAWDDSQVKRSKEEISISHNWHELRQMMWDYVGIERSNKRLLMAQKRLEILVPEIHEYYSHFMVNHNFIELRNLAQVADLIIRSAQHRKESRGLHYNIDYPDTSSQAISTVLTPAC